MLEVFLGPAFYIFTLFTTLLLLAVGWIAGRTAERRHLRSLDRRERQLAGVVCTDLKSFPGRSPELSGATLVLGATVIASDYMKSFLASFRLIFGGEVRSFQSLVTRGRREALARMLTSAYTQGYDAVCNVRFETSDVGAMSGATGAMVEVIAYGTAYRLCSPGSPAPSAGGGV